MIRQKVKSSDIDEIGYDKGSQILEVKFLDGSIYDYFNVPIDRYWGISQADSKGKYLTERIKGQYRYERLSR